MNVEFKVFLDSKSDIFTLGEFCLTANSFNEVETSIVFKEMFKKLFERVLWKEVLDEDKIIITEISDLNVEGYKALTSIDLNNVNEATLYFKFIRMLVNYLNVTVINNIEDILSEDKLLAIQAFVELNNINRIDPEGDVLKQIYKGVFEL